MTTRNSRCMRTRDALRAPRPQPSRIARCHLVIAFTFSLATAAHAQFRPQPELRLDVLGPHPYSVQPSLGTNVAFGTYARATAIVGYSLQRDTNQIADHWRVDLLGRFLFDPFRQQRWGFSVGGGVSIRHRTYIAALLDLEGPETAGWLPAVHIGVSGGLRGGFALRRATEQRR